MNLNRDEIRCFEAKRDPGKGGHVARYFERDILKEKYLSFPDFFFTLDREREKRGSQASLLDSWDFVCQSSIVRELKLLYAMRATCGFWNHKISSRSKVRVFTKTEKRQCLGKSR